MCAKLKEAVDIPVIASVSMAQVAQAPGRTFRQAHPGAGWRRRVGTEYLPHRDPEFLSHACGSNVENDYVEIVQEVRQIHSCDLPVAVKMSPVLQQSLPHMAEPP